MPEASRARAIDELIAPVAHLRRGRWSGEQPELTHDGIGLLVLDGLRIRRVGVDGRFGAELLGEGMCPVPAWRSRSWPNQHNEPHPELALGWACQPGASERYHSLRLGMVRGFAQYLATIDPQSEIPPAGLLSCQFRRTAPYLYSEREITELMAAAGALTPALKAATYQTVIGLLAVTGIRIGEALGLDREDVLLDDGVLRLRVAKQHKQRLVPLHETTTDALDQYARVRDRACRRPATQAFFFSISGARISGSVFDTTFRTLLRQVQPQPSAELAHRRVHDLRHTFAVSTLQHWHHAGVDVDRAMPLLSTYLGHIDPLSTYWYLHATPELMRPVATKLEGIQGGRS